MAFASAGNTFSTYNLPSASPTVVFTTCNAFSSRGNVFQQFSNEQQFRWLAPHKGVVHLALASVTNACYDLWAKKRGVPLWKLLTDLSAQEILNTLDLSYLEDELTREQALALLQDNISSKSARLPILESGYPGHLNQ